MVLLRKVIGDALRARRLAQHRTLREVSTAANVSLGYLSEIERGHKEASSELLASICEALGARLSEMLTDVSTTYALAEQMDEAFSAAVRGHDDDLNASGAESRAFAEARRGDSRSDSRSDSRAGTTRTVESGVADPRSAKARLAQAKRAAARVGDSAVTDGEVTVSVHSDGPLRTTLTALRAATPGQRPVESALVR